MAVVSSPLLFYIAAHPAAADQRLGELGGPLAAASRGDLHPLLAAAKDTLLAILWRGSEALPYHYNVPGRPVLQPVWALSFLVGLVLTLRGWRQRQEFLLLAALATGLAPVLLSSPDALHMRGVIALPLLFIIAGRGLWAAGCSLRQGLGKLGGNKPAAAFGVAALVLLLLWHAVDNGYAYFVTWAQAEPTQRIYNADLRAIAAYLDAHPDPDPVIIGSNRLVDLDAKTFDLYQPRAPDVHWTPLPLNLPLPAQGSARYFLLTGSNDAQPPLALLQDAVRESFTIPAASNLARGFRLSAADIDEALRRQGVRLLPQPLTYGDILRLDAVGVQQQGDTLMLTTRWTTLAPWPYPPPAGLPPVPPKFSIRLTDANGDMRLQHDQPSTLPHLFWRPGDVFVESTPLTLPDDLPAGDYQLRLVVYDDAIGQFGIAAANRQLADIPVIAEITTQRHSQSPP